MRSLGIIVVLIVCSYPLQAGEKSAAKDLKALQGVWDVTAVSYNGKDYYKKTQNKFRFNIKGNEITVEGNKAVSKEYGRIKFKLDPSVMPNCVDLMVSAGNQLDLKMEAIYLLKGDVCKLCVRIFGTDRPGEFSAPDGSNNAYLVLKKRK